jgi:hypothetical protein
VTSSVPRILTPANAAVRMNHVPQKASRAEFFSSLLREADDLAAPGRHRWARVGPRISGTARWWSGPCFRTRATELGKVRHPGHEVAGHTRHRRTTDLSRRGIWPDLQRYCSRPDPAIALRIRLTERAASRVRYGRRRHIPLRREGWAGTHKRTYCLYRKDGLSILPKVPGPKRACPARQGRHEVGGRNEVWAMDFVSDQLSCARAVQLHPQDEPDPPILSRRADPASFAHGHV